MQSYAAELNGITLVREHRRTPAMSRGHYLRGCNYVTRIPPARVVACIILI